MQQREVRNNETEKENDKYRHLPALSASEFLKLMREKRAIVELDNKLANRSVNEGFSGGEKKRNEIFQMAMLEPTFAILDETDSGLDVDALRIVADGFNKLKTAETSAMVITHYQRLLDYIKPDTVHVLLGGRIVKTGGPELAKEIFAELSLSFKPHPEMVPLCLVCVKCVTDYFACNSSSVKS